MTTSDTVISPGTLHGVVPAMASKSYAHRLLMAAALADRPTTVRCRTRSQDILATVRVLGALGAVIADRGDGFEVTPIERGAADEAVLDCGESGTTERFIVPIAAALGRTVAITGCGRLAQRPLSPMSDLLRANGVTMSAEGAFPIRVSGGLRAGSYAIAGNVSSQFVGGMLFALAVLPEGGELTLTGRIESAPYIRMTVEVLRIFGLSVDVSDDERRYRVSGTFRSPGIVAVEGDWSNAAFWLCAGALGGEGLAVSGLNLESVQGDRAVLSILRAFGAQVRCDPAAGTVEVRPGSLRGLTIDAAQIPDLVPVLAVVAAAAEGTTRFTHAGRLRIKESDRLESTAALLRSLGAAVEVGEEELAVTGGSRSGGVVSGANDHRIVMAAAVAALTAQGPVRISGSHAVRKSYPAFFDDFRALGGSACSTPHQD